MISEQDIEKLKLIFVEREEFVDLCIEVGELKQETERKQQQLEEQLSDFVGLLVEVQLDNGSGNVTLNRHERQIQALSEGAGIRIPQD